MDVFVEEYFFLAEYMQGNVNVPGLVFDDLVEESFLLEEECFFVFLDTVDDSIGIACDYSPFHWTHVVDSFDFQEVMGNVPVEVYKHNVLVAYSRRAAPVQIWWMGVNVVHGPDAFFEEVYSNLHCRVPYTQAIPYYWHQIYESLDVEFDSIQPHPGIHVARYINTGDLINFRHTVTQQYFFNSQSYDRFGVFPRSKFGYGVQASSELVAQAMACNIVGATVNEALGTIDDGSKLTWNGVMAIDDRMFIYDAAEFMRGFMESVDDFFELDPSTVELYWMVHKLAEELDAGDAVTGTTNRFWSVFDQVRLATTLGSLRASYPQVGDAIEVDLDTGMAHLVRDNLASEMGLGEEVTDG